MKALSPLPKYPVSELDSQIFSVNIASDSSYMACALSSGEIGLFSGKTGRLSYRITNSTGFESSTCIKFLPNNPKSFLVGSTDGTIKEWNTNGEPNMKWTTKEKGNQIFALDISANSQYFVSAGLDKTVRVYDYVTKSIVYSLFRPEIDDGYSNGHTNRIFSVIFNKNDPTILYSGGWDDTIQMWDLRSGSSVRSVFGPHICGDSIDVFQNYLVAGSWRTQNQIQLFDLRNFSEIKSSRWSNKSDDRQCLIYSLKFDSNGQTVYAGGSGDTKVKSFCAQTLVPSGKATKLDSSILSMCTNADSNELIIGTASGKLYWFGLQHTKQEN